MDIIEIPREQMKIPGENYFHTATPFFRYENVLNVAQSEAQTREVREMMEVVEVRFAANPQYCPVFPADAMYRKVGNRIITWAERFKDQYNQFLSGAAQQSEGTPLEELKPYGITDAQLSLCRALNIYSIEGLHGLEGPAVKRLGLHGNELKPMAKRYMEAKAAGVTQSAEIAELKRQIAEMSTRLPETVPALPDGYENMTDAELKAAIAEKAGATPRGNPSRSTLVSMAEELGVAA